MESSDALYRELKPDITALASPLMELSELLLRKRNNFLPHGAVLTDEGHVKLVARVPDDVRTSSPEVLPMLHDALRRSAKAGVKAIAFAVNVTILSRGGKKTQAIKVLMEHRRGLVTALYFPYKKRLFRGYEFGNSFGVAAAPEVNAWPGRA